MLMKTPKEVAEDINWATKQGAAIQKADLQSERKYKDRVRDRLETCRRILSEQETKRMTEMESIVEGL